MQALGTYMSVYYYYFYYRQHNQLDPRDQAQIFRPSLGRSNRLNICCFFNVVIVGVKKLCFPISGLNYFYININILSQVPTYYLYPPYYETNIKLICFCRFLHVFSITLTFSIYIFHLKNPLSSLNIRKLNDNTPYLLVSLENSTKMSQEFSQESYKVNCFKLVVSVISGSQISECKGQLERPEIAQIQSQGEGLNYILIIVLNELFRDAPSRPPHTALMCRVKVINSCVKYNSRDYFQRYPKLCSLNAKTLLFRKTISWILRCYCHFLYLN